MGRKDRYSFFKNISERLCEMINCGDCCGAWEFFACNNDGFTIQEILRFKMDCYSFNRLLDFAKHISLNQTEIEQYKYYFREKERLDSYKIPSTAPLDPICVFSDVSEKMAIDPTQMEYYTSYINYFISTHKDSFWSRCLFPGNRGKLSQKFEEMYKKRYNIECNLRAFRMNFCDFYYNDKVECICKFKDEMDLKIEIAARDANVITNMYTIAYTVAERSTVQEFVNQTTPVMHDLLTHRKWYGYENFTLLNISIEIWIKAYLCLLFRSIRAIEASQMVVNISQDNVETDFGDVDIPVEYMATILDYLTIEYGNHSQKEQIDDYREKPLLRYKGCIYLLPYVILASDIINIILQESKKENRGRLDKRGITYENVTRDKWRKVVGCVGHCKGFDKTTNTHNECDMAFVFDDCLLRPNTDIVIPKFLLYILQGGFVREQIYRVENTGSTVSNFNISDLRKLHFVIPPIEIQKHIIEKLDGFSCLCANISDGLPAEILARHKQYEYYRNILLKFPERRVEA